MGTPIEQQIDAQADANGNAVGLYSVPTFHTWELQRMIAQGDSEVVPPDRPGTLAKFRGNWSGDGQLYYTQDFSGSAALPAGFTVGGDSGRFTRVATPAAGGNKPSYTFAAQFDGGYSTQYITMTMANIPELAGVTVTKVSAWLTGYESGYGGESWQNNSLRVEVDGVAVLDATPYPLQQPNTWAAWQDVSVSQPKNTVTWKLFKDGRPSTGEVTGIRVYGVTPESIYALNDVVSYKGFLWQSNRDGNLSQPGTNADWTQIEGVQGGSGMPLLRVYRNGQLLDATGNANEDLSDVSGVTLKPGDQIRGLWSNCSPGARMSLLLTGEME